MSDRERNYVEVLAHLDIARMVNGRKGTRYQNEDDSDKVAAANKQVEKQKILSLTLKLDNIVTLAQPLYGQERGPRNPPKLPRGV